MRHENAISQKVQGQKTLLFAKRFEEEEEEEERIYLKYWRYARKASRPVYKSLSQYSKIKPPRRAAPQQQLHGHFPVMLSAKRPAAAAAEKLCPAAQRRSEDGKSGCWLRCASYRRPAELCSSGGAGRAAKVGRWQVIRFF